MTRRRDPSHTQKPTPKNGEAGSVDLRALSQHLGLSKGTISRALNGYPEIAERTRARVLEAAAELGYSPNRAARRLATGRNDLISYIGVGSDWMTVDRAFLSSLSSSLSSAGFGLMVSLADTMDHAEETMQQLISDKRVDGFVFNAAYPMDRRIALASAESIPAAILGSSGSPKGSVRTEPGDIPTIAINDHAVLDGLVDYLSALGHENFAYFGCDAPQAVQQRNAATLAASCTNRNLAFVQDLRALASQEPVMMLDAERAASLGARASRVLTNNDVSKPTAIFCGCERTVVALYMAARELGLSVPEELSIIGIGSSQLASWLSGGLSTVSWSLSEAGRLAADCVVAQIEGKVLPDLHIGIEAQFVARASHGPAPRIGASS